MNNERYDELLEKLDVLIKISEMNLLAGKNLTEKIRLPLSVGLKPAQIANVLDKPMNTITGITKRMKNKNP